MAADSKEDSNKIIRLTWLIILITVISLISALLFSILNYKSSIENSKITEKYMSLLITHTLKREGIAAIINPFDLYALEEGLRVKDAHGGTVTVITMGPPQAEVALREALGFGADAAVLLSDKAFAGADTWATALTLARAVEKLGGADLIFCGKQAIDGDTAQVGPMLATILDIPYVAWARKLTFGDGGTAHGGAPPGPRL